MNWGTNQHVAAALFVDFDNFFSELRNADFRAASAFAVMPGHWLRWFENGLPGKIDNGQNRNVTARYCYINPRQFGRFTPPFQQAGFSLIDCLTLSEQGTTTAQMVMGMYDALGEDIGAGEFIVMTSKPDFAPVLERLRHYQRGTIAVTADAAAPRYRGKCDLVVTIGELVRLSLSGLKMPDDPDAALGASTIEIPRERGRDKAPPVALSPITDVSNFISQLITRSPTAVSVEYLIHQVWTSPLAADLQMSNWAGYGDCASLVRNHIQELGLVEQRGYVYDPDIHQAPTS